MCTILKPGVYRWQFNLMASPELRLWEQELAPGFPDASLASKLLLACSNAQVSLWQASFEWLGYVSSLKDVKWFDPSQTQRDDATGTCCGLCVTSTSLLHFPFEKTGKLKLLRRYESEDKSNGQKVPKNLPQSSGWRITKQLQTGSWKDQSPYPKLQLSWTSFKKTLKFNILNLKFFFFFFYGCVCALRI